MRINDPISVTAAAGEYLSNALAKSPGKAIWVGINSRGCAGFKYEIDMVDLDAIDPQDDRMDFDWGTIILDKSSILYLLGSKLDLAVDNFSTKLVWDNPMARGTCGCGESFTPAERGCANEGGSDPEVIL